MRSGVYLGVEFCIAPRPTPSLKVRLRLRLRLANPNPNPNPNQVLRGRTVFKDGHAPHATCGTVLLRRGGTF